MLDFAEALLGQGAAPVGLERKSTIIAVGMSNKLATADIAIHKLLLVSNLYNWITALSRLVPGSSSVRAARLLLPLTAAALARKGLWQAL